MTTDEPQEVIIEPKPKEEVATAIPPKPKYQLLIEEFLTGDGKSAIRINHQGFANNFELFGWVGDRLPNAQTIIQMIKQAGGN